MKKIFSPQIVLAAFIIIVIVVIYNAASKGYHSHQGVFVENPFGR